MKSRIKEFCLRGLICSGFGPIIYAIIMFVMYLSGVDSNVDGMILFKGIVSTYLMAFIIAGVSIIWKEEKLGIATAICIHSACLYLCYLITYSINGWIKWNILTILDFSIIFILGYCLVWVFIYFFEKKRIEKLNINIKNKI